MGSTDRQQGMSNNPIVFHQWVINLASLVLRNMKFSEQIQSKKILISNFRIDTLKFLGIVRNKKQENSFK